MYTAFDVEPAQGEECHLCLGRAAVNLAGADLCVTHADAEFHGWRQFLPTSKATPVTGQVRADWPDHVTGVDA